MDDLIFRQDTIDEIESLLDKAAKGDIGIFYNKILKLAIEHIQKMPSAPADAAKVVLCKYCKWHGYLTCSNPEGPKGWVTDECFCSFSERREDDKRRSSQNFK